MALRVTPALLNAMYVAVNIQDILYGVELVLYFQTIRASLALWRKEPIIYHMLFSTIMLILVTIWVSANAMFGQEMWLIHSDYPGGASAYFLSNIAAWYLNVARAAMFILQLMTDALLTHRCWAIWNSSPIIIVPSILWLASLALGVVQTWTFSSHADSFLLSIASEMTLAYYTVCVFLNTTLTTLICFRVIHHGKFVKAELGRKYSMVYFSVAEIIIESALPFTLSGIAFLIALGLKSRILTPFSWVYFMMTCISPQMLILRVLKGKRLPQGVNGFTSGSSSTNVRFQNSSAVPVSGSDDPERTLYLQPLSKARSTDPGDSTNTLACKRGVSL